MESCVELFAKAQWQPTAGVCRDFVAVKHPQPSPGLVWRAARRAGEPTRIAVVVPTTGERHDGRFEALLAGLDKQTEQRFEILVVKGDPRQGRAINIAAALAQAQYLVTFDDDTELLQNDTLDLLAQTLDNHPDIGIAGGNAVIPTDASRFEAAAMRQIPRRAWKPVETLTDSDLPQHPCLIMRTLEFKAVGGENEVLPRGLDPYLREQYRKAGKRIVCIPGVSYVHRLPPSFVKLVRQFFRNGRQAAFVNRQFPQWVIETPSHHGDFRRRVPLAVRVFRLPARLLASAVRGQFIRVACESSYMLGFAREWLFSRRSSK